MNYSYLTDNYARFAVSFTKGKGMYLYDSDDNRYLDFNSGIAVNNLGHSHPHLLFCLRKQLENLLHVSNLYEIPQQARLAERLCTSSFADKAFFCNSGAEAVEAMLKLSRRYYALRGEGFRDEVISVSNAFHGRSFATLSASGNESHLSGFGRRMPGFSQVSFGNGNELRHAIGKNSAAILLEPIQGEGGLRVADLAYMRELRRIADEFDLLLLFDEVQCGNGRSGKLWSYEWSGIEPDILATAKGLGGGFPIGALLARGSVAEAFTAGSHGSTFGGNPLAMSAGNAVLDILLSDGFLSHVCERGDYLWNKASILVKEHGDIFVDHSGAGLMQGLHCSDKVTAGEIVSMGLSSGLLLVGARNNVVRLLPPLIVGNEDIDSAFKILSSIAEKLRV